ncbi:nuclear receptor coactivator 5-like isoform X2 [Sinocyclocheilus rhinocerous]|uniref:nuclear receptor coactivator 5-like isoform X2 n=1 Tax=Sinocyclocheilus rhinocerous TaxID=307959 RepID=UPI0007B862FD|nr:PREDICTED: nuclear receptor coactivator 5-like isoform X2 [Sinocyclocheilus rhinocerous]
MSHRRSRSNTPPSYTTNSNDPRELERRIFVGNLPTAHMAKKDMEDLFRPYGKIQDVNMAAERRQNKARSSPPRRPASSYGDSREPRPRSRSPVHGRDSRDHRDSREMRSDSRELRPGPPREHDARGPPDERYRGSESREKDPSYREEGYDRYYRGEYDCYRKKEEPYPERYREPWNGRRESEEERVRPEERRRNELYRQYYEELQRRYDAERPVDCSVIVVNKLQKEYAETVGRKVRDLGMVVDLIFLNTEVSLTQALEDVSRARTPFAIIITQQHQVHRSCTVNILFGTPQEHRNMPMQDAMVLVAHNFDSFKVEHRAKERDELARKAAKMADEVLMREPDREGHPASLLTHITLLSEGRFMSSDELARLIDYLRDKRDRLVRGSTDTVAHPPPATHEPSQPTQPLSAPAQPAYTSLPLHSTHLTPASAPTATNQQQELQAKILSIFNSGSGTSSVSSPTPAPQMQGYSSSLGPHTAGLQSSHAAPVATGMPKIAAVQPQSSMMNPRPALRPPGARMAGPTGAPRPAVTTGTGINFDNPSVQKALDTLIQSGPINHLVNMGSGAGQGIRSAQGMGQSMDPSPMSHYSRHY